MTRPSTPAAMNLPAGQRAAGGPAAQPRWWEPLQPQDLVMTLLGAYVRPHRRTVWSGGLVTLLADFGFSAGAARVALARMVRRELLSRVKDGRLVHYALTPRTEHLLAEGDRRIFSLGLRTDRAEVWTILWHCIPEEQRVQRARVARRLRFLGFGTVQGGTWVSPHDREEEVSELLEGLGVGEHTGVLVGRPARLFSFQAVVERAWNLPELAERYRAFSEEFSGYRLRGRSGRERNREAYVTRTRLVHLFRGFAALDPELPDEMMAPDHCRRDAVKIFHLLYSELMPPAQRYFDAVTTAWDAGREAAAYRRSGTAPGARLRP